MPTNDPSWQRDYSSRVVSEKRKAELSSPKVAEVSVCAHVRSSKTLLMDTKTESHDFYVLQSIIFLLSFLQLFKIESFFGSRTEQNTEI